jgi:hypothetical protein
MTAGRASALALKEAYRPLNVREGDKVMTLPAIQRALIEAVREIEREIEAQVAAKDKAGANKPKMSELEIARRIAFVLELYRRGLLVQKGEASRWAIEGHKLRWQFGNAVDERGDEFTLGSVPYMRSAKGIDHPMLIILAGD